MAFTFKGKAVSKPKVGRAIFEATTGNDKLASKRKKRHENAIVQSGIAKGLIDGKSKAQIAEDVGKKKLSMAFEKVNEKYQMSFPYDLSESDKNLLPVFDGERYLECETLEDVRDNYLNLAAAVKEGEFDKLIEAVVIPAVAAGSSYSVLSSEGFNRHWRKAKKKHGDEWDAFNKSKSVDELREYLKANYS